MCLFAPMESALELPGWTLEISRRDKQRQNRRQGWRVGQRNPPTNVQPLYGGSLRPSPYALRSRCSGYSWVPKASPSGLGERARVARRIGLRRRQESARQRSADDPRARPRLPHSSPRLLKRLPHGPQTDRFSPLGPSRRSWERCPSLVVNEPGSRDGQGRVESQVVCGSA